MTKALGSRTAVKAKMRNKYVLALIAAVSSVYLMNNLVFGRMVTGFWGSYIFPAFSWCFIAFLVTRLPGRRPAAKLRHRTLLCWLGFTSAMGAILVSFAFGFLEGFGNSPYDHSVLGIIINIFYLGSLLVGMELGRFWLLRALFRERPALGVAAVSLTYSFFWFSLSKVLSLAGGAGLLRFMGETYLPAFSENVLASYLALLGGPLPAIVYRGTLLAVHWFSPILPNLNWMMRSLTGTFLPAFGTAFVHQVYYSEGVKCKKERTSAGDLTGWIVTSAVSVLVMWFSLGIFSIFPNAIVSGSMEPHIEVGDVVIVKKLSSDTLKEGDIIQFIDDGIKINHRIINITDDQSGGRVFWTKGDANREADFDPVYPQQITGKVVFVVPKAGWITIMARGTNSEKGIDKE